MTRVTLWMRRLVALVVASTFVAVTAAACGGSGRATASHCSTAALPRRDCDTAVRIGQWEAWRATATLTSSGHDAGWPKTVRLVDALVTHGRVTQPNTGHPCDSGRIIHVQLLGTFPTIAISPTPAIDGHHSSTAVHDVDIDIDERSGIACLISVATGKVYQLRHASVLYRR
jgi:hypothetical protein